MERDLSKLYDSIYLPVNKLTDIVREKDEVMHEFRYRYVYHHCSQLAKLPRFKKLFFADDREKELQQNIVDFLLCEKESKRISESEFDSFAGKLTHSQIFNLARSNRYNVSFYALSQLTKGARVDDIKDLLDNFTSVNINMIEKFVILSIQHDNLDIYKYLLNTYDSYIKDLIDSIVFNSKPGDYRFLNICFEFLDKKYGEVVSYKKILTHSLTRGKLDNMILPDLIVWISKCRNESLEETFNMYRTSIFSYFYPDRKDKITMFYQAFYMAGLAYECFVQANKKNPDNTLTEWLITTDV